MTASIDGTMCQWHMFSADRKGVQTNAADGNLDQRNVRSISVDYTSVLTHLSLNYSAKYIITPQDG